MMNKNEVVIAVAAIAVVIFLLFLLAFFWNLRLWIQALLTGVPISLLDIVGMRLRRSPAEVIVHAAIVLRHRGTPVPAAEVERCYLARAFGSGISADELADLVEEERRSNPPDALPT
ncbi:MAG: flotillin-like FloA family protein [Gemmataceae bacterium]|nr:flotillin-like FloA family protein [Gemmataceae bacterium]